MAEKGGSTDEGNKRPHHFNDLFEGDIIVELKLTPKIKKRVEALKEMKVLHDELVSKFLEEKAALETKYRNMYEPLYNERRDIVNGTIDVEDAEEAEEEKNGQDSKQETTSEEKGVPDFWFTALTNNNLIQFTERDYDALKFLKDIKCSRPDEGKGFKLEFFFNENSYFKNTVLTKTYNMEDENELTFGPFTGTEIDWFPGKSLAREVLTTVCMNRLIPTVHPSPNFFDFFRPVQIPEDEDDVCAPDELQKLLRQDYEIGSTIRDKIIPGAVSWFTGEALETENWGT